jgi:sigma-B regulation protein RsbU (phosphoserine phosphatase)
MDPSIRSLLLRLTRHDGRAESAKVLAGVLGAEDLVVFARDPEVGVLLPAPGFPQTLPQAKAWRAFLEDCGKKDAACAGELGGRKAVGIRSEDGTVMILLGGEVLPMAYEQITPLLPFVGAVFESELQALSGQGHARVARAAAQKSDELAASLSRTQAVLNTALRELHEKQEWLATTLKSIGDAVVVTDAECRVVFMNSVAASVSGWSISEAKGRPLSDVFRIHNEQTRAVVDSPVEQALKTGQSVTLEAQTYLVRKDGTEVFIDDSAAPIRNEAGRVTGAVLVFRDITERKRVELGKEELRAKERASADFEQQLIGIVSHDLRNPLAAVLMSAQLLQKSVAEPQAQRVLRRIVSSGQRANRLIRDLLDFTQARLGGGLSVTPAPMDLHEVVKQVVDETRLASPERTIAVTHEGSGGGSWDADRIAQVLSNLLSNALRYSPPDTQVQVRTRAEPNRMLLEIHNEGPPISSTLLPDIFKPMKRGENTPDHKDRGIGLGLYIVHNILIAHHATVSVQSDAQSGTTFTVSLPR